MFLTDLASNGEGGAGGYAASGFSSLGRSSLISAPIIFYPSVSSLQPTKNVTYNDQSPASSALSPAMIAVLILGAALLLRK